MNITILPKHFIPCTIKVMLEKCRFGQPFLLGENTLIIPRSQPVNGKIQCVSLNNGDIVEHQIDTTILLPVDCRLILGNDIPERE